jgi:hypothetical protein
MKTLYKTLLIWILLPTYVFTQELPVQTTWIKTDNYGRKYNTNIPKERYKTNSNGNIHGLYIRYDEDGKTIMEKTNYNNGVKHGKHYENYNSLVVEGNFVNGKQVGIWKTTKFQWIEYKTFKNGVLDGSYIKYGKDGKTVLEKGNYVNGSKEGEWIELLSVDRDLVNISLKDFRDEIGKYYVAKGHYFKGKRHGVWSNATELIYGFSYSSRTKISAINGCFSEWDQGKFIAAYSQFPTPEYKNLLKTEKEKENIEKLKREDREKYMLWREEHIKQRFTIIDSKLKQFNNIYFKGSLDWSRDADSQNTYVVRFPKGKLISLSFYTVIRYELRHVLGTDENNKKPFYNVEYYDSNLAKGKDDEADFKVIQKERIPNIKLSKDDYLKAVYSAQKYRELQDMRIHVLNELVDKVLYIANQKSELTAYEKKLKKLNAGGIGEGSYTGLFKILGITL